MKALCGKGLNCGQTKKVKKDLVFKYIYLHLYVSNQNQIDKMIVKDDHLENYSIHEYPLIFNNCEADINNKLKDILLNNAFKDGDKISKEDLNKYYKGRLVQYKKELISSDRIIKRLFALDDKIIMSCIIERKSTKIIMTIRK
jgi:hypothetical protein